MAYQRAAWLIFVLALFVLPKGVAYGSVDDELADAREAMEQKEWAKAIQFLNTFVKREPENLEARYLRGICYGERGKHRTAESLMGDFLGKGGADFAFVLERDSLYRDALYQYALVRRFANDYPEAIRLGHAQLRLKPDLAHAHVGLFKIYWRFIIEKDADEVMPWLRQQTTDHAAFFLGESYRRQGLHFKADKTSAGLLEQGTDLPKTALLLARARMHYGWGKPEAAQAFVEQAIAAISSETDALFLFDAVKYIVSLEEWEDYNQIEDPAAFVRFFEAFWARRNPMPAARVNARMTEHYRRLRVAEAEYLFYGFRAWYRNWYTGDEKNFPATYALSSDFDDRGIIFIRHGEPDDFTIGTIGLQVVGSWMYEDPLLIFHFGQTCGGNTTPICGNTMHFSPVPLGSSWGDRLVGLDALDMERKSSSYLAQGLTTDRHRWSERTKLIDLSYMTAAFRGEDRRTLVEIYYALPLGQLTRALDDRTDTVAVEVGTTVHDLSWQPVGFVRETKHLPPSPDRDALTFDRFQMDVPPDSYHVALHSRSLQTPLLGAHTFGYRAPDFDGPGLQVSDLLLADRIIEAEPAEPLTRDDLYMEVNPLGRFAVGQPVFVYFEIYNLTPSPEGRTRYSITYTLTPKKPGGLRGILQGGDQGAISLSAREQESAYDAPVEYIEIDVSDVPPGSYVMTVTVEDKRSGAVVDRSRPLDLRKR